MKSLILAGFMGTGKSSAGRLVARRLGMRFVDLDAEIERRAGRTISELFRDGGEARFRELESEALRAVLARPGSVVATGGGALVREENRLAAMAAGLVVCLQATPEEILRRVGARGHRPLIAGAAEPLARIRALMADREAAYACIPCRIDTTGKNPAQVAEEIIELWQQASR